ncbi:MAG: glycosyltransferase family 1 protein [Chloroflexi bacterium]|nr:glycosyltransferase family 1 protein [Chloroflexota bacterium]
MRVGIDLTYIGKGHGGGETYLVNLVRYLSRLDQHNSYDLYISCAEDQAILGPLAPNYRFYVLRPANSWVRIPIGLPMQMLRNPVDVLHAIHVGPPWSPNPYALMWYDLSYLAYPASLPLLMRIRLKYMIPFSARRAGKILTLSYAMKREIVATYGLPESRILVTQPGVDFSLFHPMDPAAARAELSQRYRLPQRFMLCVGSLEPRKNIYRLLDALVMLKSKGRLDISLVMVGRAKYRGVTFLDEIKVRHLEDQVVLTNFVPTADLPLFYNAAELAVYPSLYEGFGLPAAEALACGTPLVASAASAIPEVVADSALLVNALDTAEIAAALDRLMHDRELQSRYRQSGPVQAARFSWEETARLTLSAWKEIVQQRHVS